MKITIVTEVTCYLENKPGMFARVIGGLAERGVRLHAIEGYEGRLQHLICLVTDQPEVTKSVLAKTPIEFISEQPVLQLEMQNPGKELAEITALLGEHHINITSLHLSECSGATAVAIIRIEDVKLASDLLKKQFPSSLS